MVHGDDDNINYIVVREPQRHNYYYYSLSNEIAFDFNVFIKFGLFAILFLIFIGIKLITNSGEDCAANAVTLPVMPMAIGPGYSS